MLTTVRHIFGRIMHSETALHSQWDKGRKNNLLFASPSIRRPTVEVLNSTPLKFTGISSILYCAALFRYERTSLSTNV